VRQLHVKHSQHACGLVFLSTAWLYLVTLFSDSSSLLLRVKVTGPSCIISILVCSSSYIISTLVCFQHLAEFDVPGTIAVTVSCIHVSIQAVVLLFSIKGLELFKQHLKTVIWRQSLVGKCFAGKDLKPIWKTFHSDLVFHVAIREQEYPKIWDFKNVWRFVLCRFSPTQGCSGAETHSHTFFIVTWLEDVCFYSDFLCGAPDVA